MYLTQNGFLYFSHGVARKFIHNEDALWKLVPREPFCELPNCHSFIELCIRLENHNRRDGFPEVRMRQADHRRFAHALQRIDLCLDLFRIDIQSAGDDDILCAANDVEITLIINSTEIGGDEEATDAERFCRLLK